jgi:hypothetical protein
MRFRVGKNDGEKRGRQRTVHPAEAFAGYHFEIDPLIAVLGIDEVRKSDRVEFLRYHAVKIDERSRHPVSQSKVSVKKTKVRSCAGGMN